MLCHVALVRTNVSKEGVASTIRVTRTDEFGMITVGEATKIELHPNNINKEGGFCLIKSWKPIIGSLKPFRT
jgi:hypothetical protein